MGHQVKSGAPGRRPQQPVRQLTAEVGFCFILQGWDLQESPGLSVLERGAQARCSAHVLPES